MDLFLGWVWDVGERRAVNDCLALTLASSPSPWPVTLCACGLWPSLSAECAGRWWVGSAFLPSLQFLISSMWLLFHFWGAGPLNFRTILVWRLTDSMASLKRPVLTASFISSTFVYCLFSYGNMMLIKMQGYSLRNLWYRETYRLITERSLKHDMN